MRLADVDHWLDCENHAGLQQRPGAGPSCMDDFRRVVEQTTQTMPTKFADYAVTVALGMRLDGVANVADAVTGLCRLDAQHQAFIGYIDQTPRLYRHIADKEHAAGVAVPTIEHRRDIDVDDVAVLQFLV